ncbi:MAG: hypothetical protein Q8P67_14190, partial [archaeon]|nr:hypothetical protein [archaeon]
GSIRICLRSETLSRVFLLNPQTTGQSWLTSLLPAGDLLFVLSDGAWKNFDPFFLGMRHLTPAQQTGFFESALSDLLGTSSLLPEELSDLISQCISDATCYQRRQPSRPSATSSSIDDVACLAINIPSQV